MYNRVFLDSGAFSAKKKKEKLDVYEYIDFIKEHQDTFTVYANLDVIGDWEETWKNQKIMEKEGLNPLPVHHMEDPVKCLHRCLEYEYFALGGMAGASMRERIWFFDDSWEIICGKDGYPQSKVHGFGLASPELIYAYPWYCMTEEDHEVLTKNGWKKRGELSIGEEILCFNKGKTLWEPIKKIPTFEVKNVSIKNIYNRNFTAKVTDNHSWIVSNYHKKGKNWEFRKTNNLYHSDIIPRVGKNYDFPTEKKYTDELVKLMGWYWTDGTHIKRKRYKKDSIGLAQSWKVNKDKCVEIDSLLKEEEHCFSDRKDGMRNWELYGEMTEKILQIAPDKKIPLSFLFNLTREQTQMFIEASMKGDGFKTNLIRKKGLGITVNRKQKRRNLEILRIGFLLLGIPTSVSENEKGKTLQTSSVDWVYLNQLKYKEEKYTGKLWCVQVPSKAFFVRCNNKIFVTGNSIDSSSWVSYGRYGIVIVPKTTLGEYDYTVPPIKVFVTDKSPKKNVEGVHIHSFSPSEKEHFYKYLEKMKCPLGDDETEGIINNNFWRDFCNFLFFAEMCKKTEPYPWKWFRTHKTLF